MPVKSKSYLVIMGRWWISAPELVNVKILGVKRDGVGFDEKDSMPVGFERKFYHSAAQGRIYFSTDQKFFTPVNYFDRLQVFVLWKE